MKNKVIKVSHYFSVQECLWVWYGLFYNEDKIKKMAHIMITQQITKIKKTIKWNPSENLNK